MKKRCLYSVNTNDSPVRTSSILWERERIIKFSTGYLIFARLKHYFLGLLKLKIPLQKTKSSTTIRSSSFIPAHISEEKKLIWKDTCCSMFRAALFTIAKIWKQLKCPPIDGWIKKIWCVCVYVCVYKYTHIQTYTPNGTLFSQKRIEFCHLK